MGDRFDGTITLGGRASRLFIEELGEEEGLLFDPDSSHFNEKVMESFTDLVALCNKHGVSVLIQWDAKYEFDGELEYFIAGSEPTGFSANNDGEIYCRLSELRACEQSMTIGEYIASLEIPKFPDLQLVSFWVEDDDKVRHGPYRTRSDAEVDADRIHGIVIEELE